MLEEYVKDLCIIFKKNYSTYWFHGYQKVIYFKIRILKIALFG